MKLIPGEWRYVEDDGTFLPWYTGPCLEWLKTLPLKGMRVFEYGRGASSFWYAAQCGSSDGIDTDPAWNITGDYQLPITKEVYLGSIYDNPGRYDIIIIDGDWRDDCTEHALVNLKPGGFLIIDNFEQPSFECDWTKTKELIKDMDQVLFKEPDHPSGWQTLVVKK